MKLFWVVVEVIIIVVDIIIVIEIITIVVKIIIIVDIIIIVIWLLHSAQAAEALEQAARSREETERKNNIIKGSRMLNRSVSTKVILD